MKTKLKTIIGIIIGIAIVVIVILKLKSNKEITQQNVYHFNKEAAINVQADTIKIELLNIENTFSGTFEPNRETKISTEIPGKINNILVDAGSTIKKGQILVKIDHSILNLQLQSIEVQIEGLKADVNRFTILAKADAITGVQLEKAQLGLKSSQVQKATLQEQINKTNIKAPFDGIVTAKLSEEGAYAAPGTPLLQITDLKHLKFTINVPENELNQFELNNTYKITADAYPETVMTGKAILIGSKANLGNSFPVQFKANNSSDLKIKSGMFGKIHLNTKNQEKGIIIPSSAITGTTNNPQVYVIKNGKATLQNITISKKIKNESIIKSGLQSGDIIVTSGFINIYDNASVTVL